LDTELHFLSYDPEAIMAAMQTAYVEAGGDILYPGDEKEILLRAVLAIMVQAFAGIDNALRMDTLQYAVRDYLDLYGQKRNCVRIEAVQASATVDIYMDEGEAGTIPAGTALTEDGTMLYELAEDVTISGSEETVSAPILCTQAGAAGNGLLEGAVMQFLATIPGVISVTCTTGASGGRDREDDETYRERIRTYGLSTVTTGPSSAYEAAAEAVSTDVVDARALNTDDGEVTVYILPTEGADVQTLLAEVEAALSAEDVRPLTDHVLVDEAEAVEYTLNVSCRVENTGASQDALEAAADDYQTWQDRSIGRAFNPDKLMAQLYQAGATRVTWDAGSEFDGGTVEYTEILASQYCKGTITVTVVSA